MSKDKVIDVKAIGSAVIVSFVTGGERRLWRADMSQLPTVSFHIKEQAGKFSVMIASADSEEEIISFTDKKKAVDALDQISDAVMTADAGKHPQHSGWFVKLLKFVFFVLILVVLWQILIMPRQQGAQKVMMELGATSSAPQPVSAPPVPAGVPVPADDVLGR